MPRLPPLWSIYGPQHHTRHLILAQLDGIVPSTMAKDDLKPLRGFRDFFPEDCAARNYVFEQWRAVARAYGFVEYEGPILEPTDLYRKKSGDEITGQLFCFEDKGERDVAMRPELTPSLARMAVARQRDYKKPLKWFEIGQCFRYETPQQGRLREFYQFNCDILGEASPSADAELIALAIDLMRRFGFSPGEIEIRLSDRTVWSRFLEVEGIAPERVTAFLQVIDKLEKEKPDVLEGRLAELGTSLDAVTAFIADASGDGSVFADLLSDLDARGLGDYVRVDLGIVRGLAYYTGAVFEVFDKRQGMRAIAGGGRYNELAKLIGGSDIPAAGFAMGDVVISNLIRATGGANSLLCDYLSTATALDAYVVIADEAQRANALGCIQKLRQSGFRVDYPLSPSKVGKQFQSAENFQAKVAIVYGHEFPAVKVKDLRSREEREIGEAQVPEAVRQIVERRDGGPALA